MDVRLAWTDCGETGDYVVPNLLSPRDLVSRTEKMEETVKSNYFERVVLHTHTRSSAFPFPSHIRIIFH